MTGFDELKAGLARLEIPPDAPVIIHAALSAFGPVDGGARSLLEALQACFTSILAPTFTYKTMLVPEVGPPGNGMSYGSAADANRMAEFYSPDLPADRLMGVLPETLRLSPNAERSMHPILSFSGIGAGEYLQAQSLAEPLAPIRLLFEKEGWVLLLGVNQTVNTSIHYAEYLAGRKQFVRWALTQQGVVACPGFPGCSDGFETLSPKLAEISRVNQFGQAIIQAVPLAQLIPVARQMVAGDPLALLCENSYCERCQAVREMFKSLEIQEVTNDNIDGIPNI
jgi:aminoglycoside 3-N-acetyltransferase